MSGLRRLLLLRHRDPTGVSGVGVVAEGVQFSDGSAALRWHGEHATTSVYDSGVEAILAIHGHGGATEVVYTDPRPNPGRAPARSSGRRANSLCGTCGGAWPCDHCTDRNERSRAHDPGTSRSGSVGPRSAPKPGARPGSRIGSDPAYRGTDCRTSAEPSAV